MNIVFIPCHRRAEFLAETIRHITEARNADRQFYLFQVDEGHSREVEEVLNKFPFQCRIRFRTNRQFGRGNAQNVISGIKWAVESALAAINVQAINALELIYLIEDDIFVARDFFEFHELAHETFNPYAVSACRNQYNKNIVPDAPELVYYHEAYQSLGVSFSLKAAADIAVHDTPLYYKEPNNYLRSVFPSSRVLDLFFDSDGLIHHVIERVGKKTLYACSPRAYHVGFTGLNRIGKPLEGTLKERIAQLRAMTEEEMNDRAQTRDIRRCDMEGKFAERLAIWDGRN